ncbi:MAG: hypothetical protein RLZZ417_478 [Bacteroidota bacterium]
MRSSAYTITFLWRYNIFFNRRGKGSYSQCFAEGICQDEIIFFYRRECGVQPTQLHFCGGIIFFLIAGERGVMRGVSQGVFVLGRLITFFVRNLMVVRHFYNPLATLRIPFFKLFTLKLIRRPSLHLVNFR